MLEAVLIDLLIQKGIIDSKEALHLSTIKDIYEMLIKLKEITRLSDIDEDIIEKIEVLINSDLELSCKTDYLMSYAQNVENRMLKAIILKAIKRIEGMDTILEKEIEESGSRADTEVSKNR